MDRFIGRKEELEILENLYNKQGFQMMVMYGRRRIGKSTLIEKFLEGKKSVYYVATKEGYNGNINKWIKRILKELPTDVPGLSLNTADDVVDYLDAKCRSERIVIVIDELPYLAESDKGLLSVLQNAIDEKWMKGNMMLILCGSSVSFMIDEVLSEKSPLFGRRTSQLEVKAFNYIDSAKFVPNYSFEEKAICYGITGGVAKYLSFIDNTKTLDENIVSIFFLKGGFLLEEPNNLLVQEYRNVSIYSDIIQAMADGANRVNEIADKAHLDVTAVAHALPNLIKTGIVSKDFAITNENNNKKIQYIISDNMFRFWYRFVAEGLSAIEFSQGKLYYMNNVKPFLHEYMGCVFEDMCRYYTLYLGVTGKLNSYISTVGKWWGTNPAKKEATDIDIVGINKQNKKAVLGECKFRNTPIDKDVFEALLDRNGLIDRKYNVCQYILFSLSGFSKWIYENTDRNEVMLVALEDMYTDIAVQ